MNRPARKPVVRTGIATANPGRTVLFPKHACARISAAFAIATVQ